MDKTALVVGGARGIGAAMVRQLVQDGWQVAFSYCHSEDAALALAGRTGAHALRGDVRDEAQASGLTRQALAALRHLDAVIYNAGVSYWGLASQMSTADWDQVFSVNLRGAFLLTRQLIPHLVARQTGSLLFISSMWGLRGASCEAAYAASKAGMIAYASSLAQELGPSGIRVNCLAPGAIMTDMLAGFSQEELDSLAGRSLLKRLGRPEEVARAAAFLVSQRAAYITGQTVSVDGGFV